ncbi:two-component system, OmpR family, phosphate regulon sensor histidine kinase PhoR [Proteiniborus sp. DW1]|uniref:sensor histidine kinase n=1 Tax=Proteiniborus sp. DW1 TaxID=1889883 RepID=UPI00092DF939|nr:ATP-binding protein [Proteiniborus sp. DW1]SCG82665.1 two-component system, OmpR family, phosphate regulon sensor histidine kinase PhoR [Proteiniborus sp. DW1]
MRKRIKLNLYLVGGISILLTAILTMLVYYGLIKQQTQKELRNYGQLLEQNYILDKQNIIPELEIRVTFIEPAGKVIYDTSTDASKMDNHKNRPEIMDAQKKGVGEAIRYSNTLADDTIYYAILLEDGNILRISKQIHSIWSLFLGVFPIIISIGAMVFLLCLLLSNALTDRIIRPIEKMVDNINTLDNSVAYDELIPFTKKIREQNIHILKQIEHIEQEKNKIQLIIENMSEGFLLLNTDKIILSINHSAIRLLYAKDTDYLGKNILYLSRNEMLNNSIDYAVKGESISTDIFINSRYIQIFSNPVYEKDKIIGVMCILLDVTAKKESEKIRREFTANVSHELKTPLTTISGYAELIENDIARKEDIKGFATKIRSEATRLIFLINDIIKLSELEEPKTDLQLEYVDLLEIAIECENMLTIPAQKKNVKMKVSGESCKVLVDRNMIEELIYNLCDNAIRYNKPNGTVTVTVKSKDKSTILSVEDTGIGIPEEHQSRIFERFYRVDRSRSKATGGTGLGLSIVKHIVQQHNAKITLSSEVNVGTKITVIFTT